MSKYKNTVGLWPRAYECSNGDLIVGSGTMTTAKGKKIDVAMFANMPEDAPKKLVALHEEYWEAMNEWSKKRTKKLKKKDETNRPIFSIKRSKS